MTRRTVHVRKLAWLIGVVALAILVAAVSLITITHSPPPPRDAQKSQTTQTAQTAIYFHTLSPGAKLPSSAECARLVRESPGPELRPSNGRFNHTVGQHVPLGFFPKGDRA